MTPEALAADMARVRAEQAERGRQEYAAAQGASEIEARSLQPFDDEEY